MLMILLYHWFCITHCAYLKCFDMGFIGVDIFIFLSGMGLCYAYNKYSLTKFYLRRIERLYPAYLFMAFVITTLYAIVCNCVPGVSVWFYNVSFLQYFIHKGIFFDWYISALLLLCLLFPLLYRCRSATVVIVLYLMAYTAAVLFDIPWQFRCLTSRVYIFVLGMLTYDETTCQKKRGRVWVLCLLIMILAFVLGGEHDQFLYVGSFTPLVICALYFIRRLAAKAKRIAGVLSIIDFIGKNSLLVYASNVICMHFYFANCNVMGLSAMSSYWILQLLWFCIFYLADKYVLSPIASIVCRGIENAGASKFGRQAPKR